MKRILLITFAAWAALAAQPQCSSGSLHGTYAVFYNGWGWMTQQGSPLPLTVPAVIQGVVSIDYDGKLSGVHTLSMGGRTADYDITGQVTIKSDCTGEARYFVRPKGSSENGTPYRERFIRFSDSQEIQSVIVSSPGDTQGLLGLGVWRRITPVPDAVSW